VRLVSQGDSIVAVSRWLGHSSTEITYRVHASVKPDGETATRAARATTLAKIIPDVYPTWIRETST